MVVDDEELWQAVLERREEGRRFVYAVSTTGVYCRPTCPSRRPLRGNVAFHPDAEAAEAAGFRACLRCRPELDGAPRAAGGDGAATAAPARLPAAVAAATAEMRRAGGPVPLQALAAAAGTSVRQLQRSFTAALGVGPRAYGEALRVEAARGTLTGSGTVADAAFGAGYGSMRGFYDGAGPRLGVAPARFAAGGDGEELLWTAVDHPIGTLVVVVSRRGVVAARIDGPESDGTARLAEVAAELPRATLTRDDDALADVAAHLRALASGLPAGDEVPLDVRGTAFQAAVWAALRTIPAGETRTYAQVAASIDRPSAVRAVASACAANPAALVTPCHRVIRGDGGLGGFRWGLEVKRALLEAESTGVR